MIEIDENDSNTIIIIKLSIAVLSILVASFSVIKTAYRILKKRFDNIIAIMYIIFIRN